MNKKIVLINASQRPLGNCHIVALDSYQYLRTKKIPVELINLSELKVSSCEGCLTCVFKGNGCKIKDDVPTFFEKIMNADGVMLIAPTYFLFEASVIKLLIDRSIMNYKRSYDKDKRGFSVSIGGLSSYMQGSNVLNNLFFLVNGFYITGSIKLNAHGPGVILLNDENLRSTKNEIDKLLSGATQDYNRDNEKLCPVCFNGNFSIAEEGFICPVCSLKINIIQGKVIYNSEDCFKHRFTKERALKHMESWVVATRQFYKEDREKIRLKKQPYRDFLEKLKDESL